MTCPKAVLKSVGPKLVPFFKTVAIYFVLFIPDTNPSWFACLIKCLPIVSLGVFVLLHGMSLGQEYCYSRRILTGLVLCGIGDAFLIYKTHFIHGMFSFGLGHLTYVYAFGFKPFNTYILTSCMVLATGIFFTMLPGLHGAMVPSVAIYFIVLSLMAWRAIARVQLFEDLWTWTKLCSCAGGILFCFSDALIGVHNFIAPIPHAQVFIMVFYYAAQLGMALSVVDSMASNATNGPSTKGAVVNAVKTQRPMRIKVN